ncbi:MAG TPA: DUF6644 family protein [Bryobacteraceae bacterium]|jgi:hypothetical protein
MLGLLSLFLTHGLRWAAQSADDLQPAQFAFARFPSWFPFFAWVDMTRISTFIKGTTWVFPLVETIHILALAVLLGSVFLINLRLLGIAVRRWSPAQILEQVRSLVNWSVVIILITGVLLFIAEPRKLFDSAAFGPKMIFLAAALLFQYTLYPRVRSMQAQIPIWGRLLAVVSLTLWFGVAVCGRAIGFV